MKNRKQLVVKMAVAAGMAMLMTTSAFAESRRENETRRGRNERESIQRERARDQRRGDISRNRPDNRRPYYANGRVTNVHRHGSGYRVFVHGARLPFFIPAAHYRRDRFRVGVSINIGGIYNPGGYYDYYEGRYDDRRPSRADVRGYVERVDYRRDLFVVRDERSGRFITVIDRDRRREVRRGDFVEVFGDWNRSGVLRAYDIDLLDSRYSRRY